MEIKIDLSSLKDAKNSLTNLKGTAESLRSNVSFSSSKGSTSDTIEEAAAALDGVRDALAYLIEKSIQVIENTAEKTNQADKAMADAINKAAEEAEELLCTDFDFDFE